MNGTAFFLVVNCVVAVSFSALFAVVATLSSSRKAALCFATGFGVASFSAVCELVIASAADPKIWAIGAFATVLIGILMLGVGINEFYGGRSGRFLVAFGSASLLQSSFIYDMPRGTPLHALLYQTPFTIIVLNSAYVVFTSRRAMWGDRLLYILLLVTGLHFFAKAAAAVLLGSGKTAKDYIGTSYALVSQSLTAVLMVAVGLALLSVLVLEVMKTSRQESETDFLSGLANRRGFHRKVENLAAEMPEGPHAIIICDLDHFKKVNDLYGHVVGDLVIEGFGQQLRAFAPDGAILGRMGGEEFAIILPKTEIDRAVQFAQLLRNRMAKIPNLPSTLQVTASLGVSSMTAEIEFSDAYRQADTALYNAKAAGRNRVKIAKGSALRVS